MISILRLLTVYEEAVEADTIDCHISNELDALELSHQLNETIKTNQEFKDYKKVVITKNCSRMNVNGWDFITFTDLITNKFSI